MDNDVISYEFETSAESLAVCNGKQGTCDRLIMHILPLKFSVFMSLWSGCRWHLKFNGVFLVQRNILGNFHEDPISSLVSC